MGRKQATTYKELYYKTLSRNKILDLSDFSTGSQSMKLGKGERELLLNKNFSVPVFKTRDFECIDKVLSKLKDSKQSLKKVLNDIKDVKSRVLFINKSKKIVKFILKKHLHESYFCETEVVKSFSEGDYLAKFWCPLIEKWFKNTGVIPHWGDTEPTTLLCDSIQIRMDLRLVSVSSKKAKGITSDHGTGEFTPAFSNSKYYKDKRKTVVASKSAINNILSKNKSVKINELFAPYIIVMSFEMNLCYLAFDGHKLYYTKKLRTIRFPTNFKSLYPNISNLIQGLDELLEMCLFMKKFSTSGAKPKPIDCVLGEGSEPNVTSKITRIIWGNDEGIEDDDSDDDHDDDADDGEEGETEDEDSDK